MWAAKTDAGPRPHPLPAQSYHGPAPLPEMRGDVGVEAQG